MLTNRFIVVALKRRVRTCSNVLVPMRLFDAGRWMICECICKNFWENNRTEDRNFKHSLWLEQIKPETIGINGASGRLLTFSENKQWKMWAPKYDWDYVKKKKATNRIIYVEVRWKGEIGMTVLFNITFVRQFM